MAILKVHISYTLKQAIGTASATVLCTERPAGSENDELVIALAGHDTAPEGWADPWPPQRFLGRTVGFPEHEFPHTCEVRAKDYLSLLEEYTQQENSLDDDEGKPGKSLDVILGGPSSGTLKAIILAVFAEVGIPGTAYDAGTWADPSHVYGLVAPEEFVWRTGTTAAAYLTKLLEASELYRLFTSADGLIYLAQMKTYPSAEVTPEFTLWDHTGDGGEPADILGEANVDPNIDGIFNAVVVDGYDEGDGDGPVHGSASGTNTTQPVAGSNPTYKTSTLIEDATFAGAIAAAWLPEVNRPEIWTASVPTPRDDVFGLAQIIYLDAPERAAGTGMGIQQPGFVQELDIDWDGKYLATLKLVGGAMTVAGG